MQSKFYSSLLLLFICIIPIYAADGDHGFVYARPLYSNNDKWKEKCAKILNVEIQNYLMKKKRPWEQLNFNLDTALSNWYQVNIADTIRSIPLEYTRDLDNKMFVMIYNLSGNEIEIVKNPKVYPVNPNVNPLVNSIIINNVNNQIVTDQLNTYDNIFFTASVYYSNGGLVLSRRFHANGIDDAVRMIFDLPTYVKEFQNQINSGKLDTSLPDKNDNGNNFVKLESSAAISRFNAGKGMFIAGSILSFASVSVVLSGNSSGIRNAAMTLALCGQAGFVLCGASNLVMKSAYSGVSDLNFTLNTSGFVRHGVGLGLTMAGLVMIGAGLKNNSPIIIPGIVSVPIGYVLITSSWVSYCKNYKRLNSRFNELHLSPTVTIGNDGTYGGGLLVSF